ncbi:MAG: IPT/TIG domain-containing protein [Dehalococcoidia bacterium]
MHRDRLQNAAASAAVGASAVLTALACSSSTSPPHVTDAVPSHIAAAQPAFMLIEGSGFNRGATVRVGDSPLGRVTWVNERLLTVEVPAGMPPGSYDLNVSNPGGAQTTLQQAVSVQGSAPAGVAATAAAPSRPVATAPAIAPPTVNPRTPTPLARVTSSPRPTPSPEPTRAPTNPPTQPATGPATRSPAPAATQQPPRPTSAPTQATRPQTGLNLSGQWTIVDSVTYGAGVGGQYPFVVVIQQAGNQIAGSGGGLQFSGTISGNAVHVDYLQDNGATGTFDWTVSADGSSLTGSFTNSTGNGGDSSASRAGSTALASYQSSGAPDVQAPRPERTRKKGR